MSAFIEDAFFATGYQKKAKRTSLSITRRSQDLIHRCETEYDITAKVVQHGFVDAENKEIHNELMRSFRKRLYTEIFGDFYETFYILERAILEEDFNSARAAMMEVWKEVRP